MIAESYLQLRSELETAVAGLLKLASEMRRTTPWLDMLQGFLAEIRQPLLVAVLGEAKSGKSSLLNALLDEDFATEVESDRLCLFQYGPEPKSIEISPGLRELYLTAEFLRHFTILDTPDIGVALRENRQSIVEFIARADLVLLVFSLARPWTRSGWDIFDLEDIPLKNFVFVLQQADLREPAEIEIIRRNLEDIATQKLGFTPPIFAVSARDALLARTKETVPPLRSQNQFDALKEQINLVVTQSGGRIHNLRPACQLAQVVLHDLASEVRSPIDSIAHDEDRLTRAQALLQVRREQTSRRVDILLNEISRTCRDSATEGLTILRGKLSIARLWKMLGDPEAWLRGSETEIEEKVRGSVEQHIERAADSLDTDLRALWPELHDVIDQQLVTELKEKVPRQIPGFAQQRQDLLNSIHRALHESVSNNSNPQNVVQLFSKTTMWLRSFAAVAGLGITGALFAIKFSPTVATISAGVAFLAAGLLVVVALLRRRQIFRAYELATKAQSAQWLRMIAEQFKRVVDLFHNSVTEALAPLTEYCEAQRRIHEPVLRRAEELQRALAKLASGLR
jgi:predicted GTPase